MNDLAYSILWCIAQITLLALVASAIYAIVGRVVPRIRGSVALTSLVCIIPLSALALSSWPRWSLPELPRLEFSVTAPGAKDLPVETAAVLISEPILIDDHDTSADESRKFTYRDIEVGSATIPQNRSDSHATSADLPPAFKFVETQDRAERSHINNVTVIDQPALESPIATDDAATASPTSESNISSVWPIAILLLFSLSLAIGLIRLGAGVRFVRAQRRNATVVEDPELLELVDILCSNVGGTRWVDVRESAQISTAATIGWRRPIILLPVEWPTWSSAERRAVLAHEIAHIKNRDFIAWLCAQLGLSLHYYHPLVHWLVSRLRLEQELAADALAAPLAGGATSYLQTLAAMALRQSEQPLSWPARAFLPTRDTLLRRIEMLKRPQTFSKSLFSRPVRYAAVALIIGAGAVAAGLRAGNDATETPQRSQTIILTGTDPQNIQNVPLDGFTSPRMFSSEPQLAESTAATSQAEPPLPSETPSYQPESDSDKEYVAKSKDNLVKIAAAMRKYRAVYRAYPSAVAMGPKKHPYSWRVALLPFFDGKEGLELSEQYNFEEPWDGPTNKKLLGKMPDVYRSPLDNADRRTMSEDARLAASYYMLLGPLFQSTALPADEAGIQLQNFQKWYWNGTVNDASRDRTAAMRAWSPLIIEAKRSTPWTKPSDVLFDPEGPIEQLKGWHADALPVLDAQLKTSFLARSEGSEKTVSALRQLSKSTYAATAATAPTMAPTVVVAREKVGLERAVAGMSVVYFQGKARRVVSGLVLDAGDETLFVTTSPATLHPEGLPPAIDRLELVAGWLRDDRVEFAHSQDSTNELYIARAKQRLSDFKLEQVASVSAGDHLDAAYFDSEKKLTIRGKAAKVIQPGGTVLQLALNPETIRTYRDVQQIEGRYPEGTVLLKQGKLAGLVLAGERFVRKEDNHSFFVPAERIVERYKEIRERDAVTRNTQRADRSGSLVGSEQPDDDADLSTTFRGLIVLQGTPPNLPPLIRKGSQGRMGMEFTQDIPDERLRIGMPVDIENGVVHGLANVFVYLKDAPNNTPAPVDIPSPETEILDGVFKPHALLLRTGQPVRFSNRNHFPASVHTQPMKNLPINQILAPNSTNAIPNFYSKSEPRPIEVVSDLHPWMKAYHLPLNHPYAAVTGPDGSFAIRNLPPGQHRFQIWHEALAEKKEYVLEVDGKQKLLKMIIPIRVQDLKLGDAPYTSEVDGVGVHSDAGVTGSVTLSQSESGQQPFVETSTEAVAQRPEPAKSSLLEKRIEKVREQRVQSRNNIKSILLAMHNYLDVHKHLPPSVVLGPDGKTPHSWRVELLPFLDQAKLYEKYRMNEPWDSPANKQVLAQMPDVFRAPGDAKDSTNTAYFVPTGPQTMFHLQQPQTMESLQKSRGESDVGKRALNFRDIDDGTSNTVALIETKRDVPWTRPQDIDCDPAIPLPKFGRLYADLFHVGMADGTTRAISVNTDEKSVKALLSRAGGEPVSVVDLQTPDSNSNAPAASARDREMPEADDANQSPFRRARVATSASRQRDQSRNNIKRLMLAMHNYHDVHQHFPPAVGLGPDGKTPHSWRVAILPFLATDDNTNRTYKELYERYRLDEPWDGPNNKKLLSEMPSIFRAPNDKEDSTNTAYLAVASQYWETLVPEAARKTKGLPDASGNAGATLFDGVNGVRIRDIADGTSNTIAIVESQLVRQMAIPVRWTEPDDIVYDPAKPLPVLVAPKGLHEDAKGYFAGMADGSVQFFRSAGVPERMQRALLTRAGGEAEFSRVAAQPTARPMTPAPPAPTLFERIFGKSTARTATSRTSDGRDNLKRLMLAMHNYHDVHGRFPAAKVIGPDGETPHSWRVELLPFLEGPDGSYQALFNQYKMDEPWDGPNNRKLLDQMPAVFRTAGDDATSTNTRVFAVTGPGTLFDRKEGTKISEISDGSSMTIALIETTKTVSGKPIDVPWMKPEDIEIDSGKPLQKFGIKPERGFLAALSDGSVRILPATVTEETLRKLFTRAGGEPVEIPE